MRCPSGLPHAWSMFGCGRATVVGRLTLASPPCAERGPSWTSWTPLLGLIMDARMKGLAVDVLLPRPRQRQDATGSLSFRWSTRRA